MGHGRGMSHQIPPVASDCHLSARLATSQNRENSGQMINSQTPGPPQLAENQKKKYTKLLEAWTPLPPPRPVGHQCGEGMFAESAGNVIKMGEGTNPLFMEVQQTLSMGDDPQSALI